jgi:hypothetical protein
LQVINCFIYFLNGGFEFAAGQIIIIDKSLFKSIYLIIKIGDIDVLISPNQNPNPSETDGLESKNKTALN